MIENKSVEVYDLNKNYNYFEANLSVKYKTPVPYRDSSEKSILAAGYFRKFVVVAISEHQAKEVLSIEVIDGEIDWQDSEFRRLSSSDLAEYSLKEDVECDTPDVVFRSSHFLYPLDAQ